MTQPRKPKASSSGPDLTPNKLVTDLAPSAPAAAAARAGVAGAVAAGRSPELVVFLGILGTAINNPASGNSFVKLHLSWDLNSWLLVEASGIVKREQINDPMMAPIAKDAIWVGEDAAVGRATGLQTDEAQFLTGQFTRAADFEAPPGGGTQDSSTGRFCNARTPLCCYRLSRRSTSA